MFFVVKIRTAFTTKSPNDRKETKMIVLNDTAAVVVLSGGQDSTTCLFWAKQRFTPVTTVTFDYGQRHRIELEAARAVAALADVPNTILSIPTLAEIGSGSLVGKGEVTGAVGTDGLPDSFVPGRNLIFMTFAAAFAYRIGARHLVTGVCETDYSGYPDCRRSTMDALTESINLGMEADFVIDTPLMHLTKADTVRLAIECGAMPALALSHTCYNGVFPPCGTCPACELRAKGFLEAGIDDPLVVRAGRE